jgi:hypothetical protein
LDEVGGVEVTGYTVIDMEDLLRVLNDSLDVGGKRVRRVSIGVDGLSKYRTILLELLPFLIE